MNSYELFVRCQARHANDAALVCGLGKGRRSITFAELHTQVDYVVSSLVSQGLLPGDRVLLAVPLSPETYAVMLGVLKAGMVLMYIDPAHGASRASQILRRWPPAAIVASRPVLLLGRLYPDIRRITKRLVVSAKTLGAEALGGASKGGKMRPVATRSDADAAILSFTSGSTGEPKAILRSHGFLRRQLEMLEQVAQSHAGDIDFVAMPMFVLFNLAHGITSVLPACDTKHPGRADPTVVLRQLHAENATRMLASPALLERLANHCLGRRQTLPDMRCISTGGGPVPPALPRMLSAIAPAATIRTVYGSTEAEPISSIDAREVSIVDRARTREGAGLLVGRPVRGCSVRIIENLAGQAIGPLSKAAFDDLRVDQGEVGEIVVSGKHVIPGYANTADDADYKIHVRNRVWHRTGDAGHFDRSGRLWLVGRCAARLRDFRGTIYPFQVEFAVSALRGIRRAALVKRNGERVLVVETAGRDFGDGCARVAGCIAQFDIDRIITVRRIPMDKRHGAKVDYPALMRRLDGPCAGLRERMSLACLLTACRDAIQRIRSRWQVCGRRRRTDCSSGGSDSTVRL